MSRCKSIAEADAYRILFNDIHNDEKKFEQLNIVSTGSGPVDDAIGSDVEDQSKKQTSDRSNDDEANFSCFRNGYAASYFFTYYLAPSTSSTDAAISTDGTTVWYRT